MIWYDRFFNASERRSPGSVASTKNLFHFLKVWCCGINLFIWFWYSYLLVCTNQMSVQASKDCKHVYECHDLMELCVRTNLVSYASLKLRGQEAINSFAELEEFAADLYEELNIFQKFDAVEARRRMEEEVVKDLLEEIASEVCEPEAWAAEEEVYLLSEEFRRGWSKQLEEARMQEEEQEGGKEWDQVLEERKGRWTWWWQTW